MEAVDREVVVRVGVHLVLLVGDICAPNGLKWLTTSGADRTRTGSPSSKDETRFLVAGYIQVSLGFPQ